MRPAQTPHPLTSRRAEQVLESLDLDTAAFGVILIEASSVTLEKNAAVRAHLVARGYTHLGSRHGSDWFVNDRWDALYAGLGLPRPSLISK